MHINNKGFSLLEAMISVSIFAVVMAATFSMLLSTQDFNQSVSASSQAVECSRQAMAKIIRDMEESSLETVDTSFRTLTSWSNHFRDTTPGNKYCTSLTCSWNTAGGENKYPQSYTGSNYGDDGAISEKHGRIWINLTENTCLYDDNILSSDAFLDGIKFFSPRNKAGNFCMNTDTGKVNWQAIILYFPYRAANEKSFQLKRYVYYLSDLFEPGPAPADASLFDIWDLNNDGFLGDGDDFLLLGYKFKPLGNNGSDEFLVNSTEIKWKKSLGGKVTELLIDRNSGTATWTLQGHGAPYANGTYTIENRAETVAHNLLDMDISTCDTNPFSTTNPIGVDGVDESKAVRITMVFSCANKRSLPSEAFVTGQVTPRN